jgi:hypothetical protein
MATFPLLSSGAVAQYPLPLTYQSATQVIPFIDGLDQRFCRQAGALRAWNVKLSLLSETETQQVEGFFQTLDGQYSTFDFPDPYSGFTVPNCRLGAADLITTYTDVDIASTSFWVIETNG